MPMPTKVYKVVMDAPDFMADLTEVNELASQGWEIVQMLQIGGGVARGRFAYLMQRTVTNIAEKTDG
jgi:hypothetical protein